MNAIQFPGISQGIGKRVDIALQAAICSHLLGRAEYHVTMPKTLSSERLDSCVCVNISLEGFGLTINTGCQKTVDS